MLKNFRRDLEAAREAEMLTLQLLVGATDAYTFEWVGNIPAYYNKGDIRAIDKSTGEEFFIEVKDDSRIADTGNILCEEEVDYIDYQVKGNMYNNFDVYVIVSKQAREIYVCSGEALKANYRQGYRKYIPHGEQSTDAFLLPLRKLKELGGLIATIHYNLETRRAWIEKATAA